MHVLLTTILTNISYRNIQITILDILLLLIVIMNTIIYHRIIKIKNNQLNSLNTFHLNNIDIIKKEYNEKREKIRIEMLKREEDNSRQWIESEKETLHVLSGVSNILDLSENINKIESDKIISILSEIKEKVNKLTDIDE